MADKPGHRFEREVAELFKKLGWEIRLTPSTGDLGADVVAHCLDEITVVQCKDWTANVGYDAVKEVVAARVRYKAKFAVVVSNAGYTKQARDNAPEMDVLLYRTTDLSIGSFLDRTEQGKKHRALKAFEKEEDEREVAHKRLVAEYVRYENAITANLAYEKTKAQRGLKILGALSAGVSVSMFANNLIPVFMSSLYILAVWIGGDGPVSVPDKPKQPKPIGSFQRRAPPTGLMKPLPLAPTITTPGLDSPPMNGLGKRLLQNGARYEGNFKNGKLDGYGQIFWADGSKYVGEFKDDQRTGTGELTWPNGSKYTGLFLDSKIHGYGTFIYVSGSKYEGNFVAGLCDGLGILYDSSGEPKFEGVWKQGVFLKKQLIKIEDSKLNLFLNNIKQGSSTLVQSRSLADFYDGLDKEILDYIFVNREKVLTSETAYSLSKIYFAKFCDRSSFFLKDYFKNIDEFGIRTTYEDDLSEEDALYESFWKEMEYLSEYLFLSTPFGASFTICALLTLNLFRFNMRPDFDQLFQAIESPVYLGNPLISKIKHRLILLKSAYEQADIGHLSESHLYLDSLIRVCDPSYSSLSKLPGDYERCTDPMIAAGFLVYFSNKEEVSLSGFGDSFRGYALGYNAYCNFIQYLFKESFSLEEDVISLFSIGLSWMIVIDHWPKLEFLDPELLKMSVDEACVSEDKYVRYFCAFKFLYGIGVDVDYDKARSGFEYICRDNSGRMKFGSETLLLRGACYHLSYIYKNGLGVPVDIEIARRIFSPAGG